MAEDYKFKSYDRLMEESLADESMAGDIYRYMANISPDAQTAATLRSIAADEDRHHMLLSGLPASSASPLEPAPRYDTITEIERGMGKMPSGERRFPRTYGEWIGVAEDIKARDTSVETQFEVNTALGSISNEAADPQEVSKAQRYLITLAATLGIR